MKYGKKKAQSPYARQLEWDKRKREKGFTRTNLWIPIRDVERLRAYCAELCEAWDEERGE
jgi:hypothetical protein